MRNIFIIHGTAGHPKENWFPWLKKELETLGCRVIIPQFPTPQNQTPEQWFEVFKRYEKELNSDTIIIGHSLGGAFALRILEKYDRKIKALMLVATPIGVLPIRNYEGDKPFISNPFDWERIRKNCGQVIVFHSDDDQMVSVGNGIESAKRLGAKFIRLNNVGHFNSNAGYDKFEMLRDILIEFIN
jgi:predicted alpha/beta hydrolase family esterase